MRRLLPQRLRLALWNLRYRFSAGGRALNAAQPTRRERRRAAAELERRVRAFASAERPVGIDRLDRVWFVNLASRRDRLEQFNAEAERLALPRVERFDAIAHEAGAVGCGLSHVACLKRALETSTGAVMICEDDVVFELDRARLDALVDAFLDDGTACAVCLAYFVSRSQPHDLLFRRGHEIRTASCYIAKDDVAAELIRIWEPGVAELAVGRGRAIDKLWFPLQDERVFVVPILRAARQTAGWSDIERRPVTYGH